MLPVSISTSDHFFGYVAAVFFPFLAGQFVNSLWVDYTKIGAFFVGVLVCLLCLIFIDYGVDNDPEHHSYEAYERIALIGKIGLFSFIVSVIFI